MKPKIRTGLIRTIVFTPLVLLIVVLLNLASYVLALSGVVILAESPWHYSAREFYIYHGRAILQFEVGAIEYDEQLLYRPRDGVFHFNNYEFSTTIKSLNGHRVNPYLQSQADVVILGDSFAQGWGVNDQDTVASVLTRDYGIKTLTYGVSSYNTARELFSFRRALSNGTLRRPTHLVIFYCTNDYTENDYFLNHGVKTYTADDFMTQTKRSEEYTSKRSLTVGPLMGHIKSLRDGYQKWISTISRELDYGNLYDPDPPTTYAEQVRAFKAVLEVNIDILDGLKITVVSFKGWGGKDEFGSALAAVPQLAGSNSLNVIINPVPDRDYFPLDGHMNEAGNRFLAGILASHINASDPTGSTAKHR